MDIQECLKNKYRSDKHLSKRFENMMRAFRAQPHLEKIKEIIRNKLFDDFLKNSREGIREYIENKCSEEQQKVFFNYQEFSYSELLSEYNKESISEDMIHKYLIDYFFNES